MIVIIAEFSKPHCMYCLWLLYLPHRCSSMASLLLSKSRHPLRRHLRSLKLLCTLAACWMPLQAWPGLLTQKQITVKQRWWAAISSARTRLDNFCLETLCSVIRNKRTMQKTAALHKHSRCFLNCNHSDISTQYCIVCKCSDASDHTFKEASWIMIMITHLLQAVVLDSLHDMYKKVNNNACLKMGMPFLLLTLHNSVSWCPCM